MPTYSYKCTECGTAFDIQQAFTDDSLTECPNCSGKLRKVFTAIGVTFNGSGFYRNDSRAGSSGGGKSSGGSTSSSGGSDASGGSSGPSTPSASPAPAAPAKSTPAAASAAG